MILDYTKNMEQPREFFSVEQEATWMAEIWRNLTSLEVSDSRQSSAFRDRVRHLTQFVRDTTEESNW
jgi:hypothetical protein